MAEIFPTDFAAGFAGAGAFGAGLGATLAAGFATGFATTLAAGPAGSRAVGADFFAAATFFAGAGFFAWAAGLRAGDFRDFVAWAGLRADLALRCAAAGFFTGFFTGLCLLRMDFFAGFFFAAMVPAPELRCAREK